MKRKLSLSIASLFFCSFSFAQFVYVNPLPDSKNHRPEVTIALNPGSDVEESSLNKSGLFSITGSQSGDHSFKAILSTDGHTIVLKPTAPFSHSENVTVNVRSGIKTVDGKIINGTVFSFSIIKEKNVVEAGVKFPDEDDPVSNAYPAKSGLRDFPAYSVLVDNNPAPGSYFFCNKANVDSGASYLTIMDNDTTFDYATENSELPNDWKMNNNCMFTYFDLVKLKWLMLDTDFNLIDSFQCGNGLESYTDGHEFRIYPDGHSYIEAADYQMVDMSQYVVGGDTNALVIGFTVQRLDAAHNIVFEWRSWDHFQFTDAAAEIDLTAHYIDPVHGNSMDEDWDGNLIMSERHLAEVTKINTTTGDFMWRLGGNNNMFTFVNDTANPSFYFQHCARRLPNGHLILFNNNNYQVPQQSVAKEYALDEINYVATLVWSYAHPYTDSNPVFGRAGGNAQRLANGNTVICWGFILKPSGNPNFSEVDSLGNIVFEFKYDDSNQFMYRSTKSIWQTCDAVATGDPGLVTDAAMSISPNPSSENISLSFKDFNRGTILLELENVLGEIVYKEKILIQTSNATQHVQLPGLPSGMYICTVMGDHQKLKSKLVIQ